jgi:hypothetical protein
VQAAVADIDGDGDFESLSDALLVLRWCFGLTGAALINGAVDAGCTYCTAEEVAAHLTSLGSVLDVDQNGEVTALTDAVLLMRWGFGFRGLSLVDGAVDQAKCQRCSIGAIEVYLDGLDGG